MMKQLLPVLIFVIVLFGAVAATAELTEPAYADAPVLLDAGAGSGSAAAPVASQPSPDLLGDLTELRAKYEALKLAKEKTPHLLALAALLAVVMKFLLDVVKTVGQYKLKKAMAWVAMALAVPIALFSHFAGGSSWFDALIFAGAGPGAVIVHELLGALKRKP